jgi:hypothetical protein
MVVVYRDGGVVFGAGADNELPDMLHTSRNYIDWNRYETSRSGRTLAALAGEVRPRDRVSRSPHHDLRTGSQSPSVGRRSVGLLV